MMETNTELLKTIRDFIRYCTTRLYSSEATFNHGYQNPEEEAAFLVLRTLRIPLEYEDKFLDAALTNNERETVLNNISRRCDDLEPTAYITKEWWLTGFPFYCLLYTSQNLGLDFFRRILMSYCPARLSGDKTQLFLAGKTVDLVDHAVNIKR